MSALDNFTNSPLLQVYVLDVAKGFRSSDPTNGVFKILQNFGVDHNSALNTISNDESVKLNFDAK